jgi:hypothetical protein
LSKSHNIVSNLCVLHSLSQPFVEFFHPDLERTAPLALIQVPFDSLFALQHPLIAKDKQFQGMLINVAHNNLS